MWFMLLSVFLLSPDFAQHPTAQSPSKARFFSNWTKVPSADVVRIVETAQDISVDRLDPALRPMPLESWIHTTVGANVTVSWWLSDCDLKPDPPEPPDGYPLCVGIDTRPGDVYIKLHILVGTVTSKGSTKLSGKPRLYETSFVDGPSHPSLSKLSDLPVALRSRRDVPANHALHPTAAGASGGRLRVSASR